MGLPGDKDYMALLIPLGFGDPQEGKGDVKTSVIPPCSGAYTGGVRQPV